MSNFARTSPRILIAGNLGYIGPVLLAHLRRVWPQAHIAGFDNGYFQGCLMHPALSNEHQLDVQHYGDVREIDAALLQGFDVVVGLAAVSNDPMGNVYAEPTMEINARAIARLAELAQGAGVGHFVFASSCSVYGAGGTAAKDENAELNPLTAYARSKILCEQLLEPLAGPGFVVTCLRFATACGASPRLRLDLVLNDFVASALLNGHIEILSDGTPWRPLIDVADMSRAIEWAATRAAGNGGAFLTVNAGSDAWNCTVRDLATTVQSILPGTTVSINSAAAPDKRSYRVDFARFRTLAPQHQPQETLQSSIDRLARLIREACFAQKDFRNSTMMRLVMLNTLRERGRIDAVLRWL